MLAYVECVTCLLMSSGFHSYFVEWDPRLLMLCGFHICLC